MKLGVFYPASKFSRTFFETGCKRFREVSETELICPSLPKERLDYAIGSKEERWQSIETHLLNKNEIDVLWAARGGYGSVELLPKLAAYKDQLREKTVVGFSDITAMHAWLSNQGYLSVHAPMLATKGWCEADEQELNNFLKSILKNDFSSLDIKGIYEDTQGRLVGGNLCTLCSLMGTPWQLKLKPGDILFLEEINEPYYKLVRSMQQLSATEHFDACTILFGHMTDCKHPFGDDTEMLENLMSCFGNRYGYGLQAGHDRPNYPVRLGKDVKLTGNKLIFQ